VAQRNMTTGRFGAITRPRAEGRDILAVLISSD